MQVFARLYDVCYHFCVLTSCFKKSKIGQKMRVKEIRRINARALAKSIGGISYLAKRLKKSQSQLSHLIGVNPSKEIGDKIASEMEKTFNKPVGWLDKEHLSVQETAAHYDTGRITAQQQHCVVPLIKWNQAAHWHRIMGTYSFGVDEVQVPVSAKIGAHAFALTFHGLSRVSSNGIGFNKGSIMVVDPSHEPKDGSFIILQLADNSEIMLCQLVVENRKRYVKTLDCTVQPLVELTQQAVICGTVRVLISELE